MEFFRLQWLQKAQIAAPRAMALLNGFNLGDQTGDAVILEAIEPSITLDQLLNRHELDGQCHIDHYNLAAQVIELVYALGKAGLGHSDLHLGNFLLHKEKVYLIDAYAIRRGGLKQAHVLHLGASVARFATTADIVRGWKRLGGDGRPPPADNPVSRELWDAAVQRVLGKNRYFGRIQAAGWAGIVFKHTKHPSRWSEASSWTVDVEDWEREWPALARQIEADALPVLKRGPSGDVLAGQVTLGGRNLNVVIKRPRRRYWYRYLNDVWRGVRPRRAWRRAWDLIARNLPTAWPVALFERRRMGYVTDAVLICERVPGETLWQTNLDAMDVSSRGTLFHRTGRLLRLLEQRGFSHLDAKASNWIVREDQVRGPDPLLIDVDGVRRRRWFTVGCGIQRLLRSLREKRQYTPEDSLALCRGYAPFAQLHEEEPVPEDANDNEPPGKRETRTEPA